MIKSISNLGDNAVYCDFGSEVNETINAHVIDYFYRRLNVQGVSSSDVVDQALNTIQAGQHSCHFARSL